MKKIFLAGGLLLTASTMIFANANAGGRKEARIERREARKEFHKERRLENRNVVSDLTKAQFAQDFPHAKNVRFLKASNFDEVYFTTGKRTLQAYYDYSGNLVGTTQRKTFADLPENAQKKISKDYPGYTVSEVMKFKDNEMNDMDMILYGTSFEDADNYFVELHKDGKPIVVKVDLAGYVSFFATVK